MNVFNFSEKLQYVRMCYTGNNKLKSKLNFPVCNEVWNCFPKVPNVIQPVATAVSVARPGKEKNWALENCAHEKQWKPTSTPWNFFSSFTIFSLWKFRMFTCYFFYALLVFLHSWMKKKTRNSRGKTRPMETHIYTMDFFFFY